MILNYKSIYRSQEESKAAAKKLIVLLKPNIASGSLVENVKHQDDKSIYYLTKLNFFQSDIHDFSYAQEILMVLSKSWTWRLSSAHTGKFSAAYEEGFIDFHFIDVLHNEEGSNLVCHFFVKGNSELEVAAQLGRWLQGIFIKFETLQVNEYFKIEQCYIVTVSIGLANNSFEEVREVLLGFTESWNAAGLEAYTDECTVDKNILAIQASFKEIKL